VFLERLGHLLNAAAPIGASSDREFEGTPPCLASDAEPDAVGQRRRTVGVNGSVEQRNIGPATVNPGDVGDARLQIRAVDQGRYARQQCHLILGQVGGDD
jgi:hypothetical protein